MSFKVRVDSSDISAHGKMRTKPYNNYSMYATVVKSDLRENTCCHLQCQSFFIEAELISATKLLSVVFLSQTGWDIGSFGEAVMTNCKQTKQTTGLQSWIRETKLIGGGPRISETVRWQHQKQRGGCANLLFCKILPKTA